MTRQSNEETVPAEVRGEDYRSNWTDLRHVAFSQGWIEVDGYRMRYLRSGDPAAPKLVMIPGTGGHAETYVANLGPLGEHFDCWAIDAIGSGYSDKPPVIYDSFFIADFLRKFMLQIGADRLNFIGCSAGSWYALRFAQAYPQHTGRVVLLSPVGGPRTEPGHPFDQLWEKLMSGGQELRFEVAQRPSWTLAEKVLRSLFKTDVPDDMIAARLDANRQPGAAEVVNSVYFWVDKEVRMRNLLTRDELASLRAPILGICELNDIMLPMIREMFDLLPNGRFVRVEQVGHWPHYEAPETVNPMMKQFLTQAE